MKISQLSVFMENRVGVLNEVTTILSNAEINLRAFSVSDGSEFGILRVLVSDPVAALRVLQDAGYKVTLTDVLRVNVPNEAGSLSVLLDCLAAGEVFIQYMYAFSEGDVASIVIRPNNIDRCIEVLNASRETLTAKSQLFSF
ncbi:MAG: ACT domain-containing protein [Rikenellaceae bacterium]